MDRSTLNKATSADDAPTPGYLYTEIAKATFTDPASSQQLADYLLKKLERDNPHVKLKVLRIIKHVCEEGKPDFRRAVQKRAEVVKACLQYRGAPDPLKGDQPSKAVRAEADVAVKAVFSSDSSTNAYGLGTDASRKMQGFGNESAPDEIGRMGAGGGYSSSSSFSGGGGGAHGGDQPKSFSSGGMVGFGNPNFDNNPKPESDTMFKQAVSTTFSAVSKLTNKVAPSLAPSWAGGGGAPTLPEPSTSSYRAPQVGGGPDGGLGGCGGGSGYGGGGSFGSNKPQWGPSFGGGGQRPGGAPAMHKDAGEYEGRVVEEICAPGGPRVAPSLQALDEFARKCESLDSTAVGDQLRQRLSQPDWQTRLKALCAVEALSQQGLDGVVGHISQFSSELLFESQEMPQCRQKATKVLQLLGFIDATDDKPGRGRPTEEPAAPPAPPPAQVDLLEMDDGPLGPLARSGSAAGSTDLLEAAPSPAPAAPGLATNGTTHGTVDMIDFGGGDSGSCAAPYPVPVPDSGGGSLFGSLAVRSQDGGTAQPAGLLSGLSLRAQQAPPGEAPGFGCDLLSNMQVAPGPAVQPVAASPHSSGTAAAGAPMACGGNGVQKTLSANRTAHLSFLSGGGGGMVGPMQLGMQPGMQPGMHPGMQLGMMHPGMQLGVQPGMQPGLLQPGLQHPMQGMQPVQGMVQLPGLTQMQSGQPGAMGTVGMGHPAMGHPAMGMPGGSMGGMASSPSMPSSISQAPAAPSTLPGAFGGPGGIGGGGGGGPGSAFVFIGGSPGATPMPGLPPAMPAATGLGETAGPGPVAPAMCGSGGLAAMSPEPLVKDSAFSFVADQMKGART